MGECRRPWLRRQVSRSAADDGAERPLDRGGRDVAHALEDGRGPAGRSSAIVFVDHNGTPTVERTAEVLSVAQKPLKLSPPSGRSGRHGPSTGDGAIGRAQNDP